VVLNQIKFNKFNKFNKIVRDSGVLNCTISDHLQVYVTLKLKSTKLSPTDITVRSYKNFDPGSFVADLAS
jgi:hypothetical protein